MGYCVSCCPSEWLDYILFSKVHLQPKTSSVSSIVAKLEQPIDFKLGLLEKTKSFVDVSDHFPLFATFEFEDLSDNYFNKNIVDRLDCSRNPNSFQSFFLSLLIIIAVLLGVLVLFHLLFKRAFVKKWRGVKINKKE